MMRRLLEVPLLFWLAVAAGLGYWNYYDWQRQTLAPLQQQKAEKDQEYQVVKVQTTKAEDFKRQRSEKLAQLRELAEHFKATADRLPRSSKIPDLLKSLADLSDHTGLDFSHFKPLADRKEQFLVITPLEVNLKGTYLQIMSFLDAASNLTRVVAAERLTLDNAEPRGTSSLLAATAVLVTYHIEDSAIEGAVSSAPQKVGSGPVAAPILGPQAAPSVAPAPSQKGGK